MNIKQMIKEIVDVLNLILEGQNILFFASASGIFYGMHRYLKKTILAKQSEFIKHETLKVNLQQDIRIEKQQETLDQLVKQLGSIERNLLRTQLIIGMEQKSFSKSELQYFYDKYTALGGNSFVSDKVKLYLKREDVL